MLGWASHIVWLIRNPFKSVESYYHYLYSGYRHSVTQEIDSMCFPFRFVVTFSSYLSLSFLCSLSPSFLVSFVFPSLQEQKWHAWVEKESQAWLDWQTKWLQIEKEGQVPILRVSYENFVKNPVEEVKRILEFIHFDINEAKIQCAVNTNCKENCRVAKNSTSVDIYGPEETEIMMERLGTFMKQFGYEGKPVKKR